MNNEIMHQSPFTSNSSAASIACVNKLVANSTPFIRINSLDRYEWCRVMENPKDKRIGPWKYRAVYDVLSEKVWSQRGEVLYFVVDSMNKLRLVGQSANRLKDRWKPVPMFDSKTQASLGMRSLFHTSAWPAIEAGFSKDDKGQKQYTVSAIFRADLERECRSIGGDLLSLLTVPETDHRRLSYRVEQWVCSLSNQGLALWNKQGVKRK